jgi:threonine synthase
MPDSCQERLTWSLDPISGANPGTDESGSLAAVVTPLLPSRSLGRLLGLATLWFKADGSQPSGSWADRGVARAIAAARRADAAGLIALGGGPLGSALALAAARAALRLLIVLPDGEPASDDDAWAVALGAHPIRVASDRAGLEECLPALAREADLWPIVPRAAELRDGLLDAIREAVNQRSDQPVDVVAVALLLGSEGHWLTPVMLPTIPEPEPVTSRRRRRARRPTSGIVLAGRYDGSTVAVPPDYDGPQPWDIAITAREADAARRMLAREEGLLASRRGVAGLAALMRAARAKALPQGGSALVMLANEIGGAGDGPPLAVDEAPRRAPLPLADVAASLRRAAVMPPG